MSDLVDFDTFSRLDLRVGKIINVENHPKADKLFILTVDFGKDIGTRTIVAGLKKFCDKSEIEGHFAIFVLNMEPTFLRGVRSEGMILAAVSSDDTKGCIILPKDSDAIEPGDKVR